MSNTPTKEPDKHSDTKPNKQTHAQRGKETQAQPDTRTGNNGTENKKDDAATKEHATGFLGAVERIGNKLPDPFWLFVIIGGLVTVTSWIGNMAGMHAEDPAGGKDIVVKNLLSSEGISYMVSNAVENYVTFPALGLIITVMLGVAVAEHSGLISAAVRGLVSKVGPRSLTFVVAIAGVTGSVASDAVYVILIPLGAMAFRAVGRSPIVGAMVAFAASSAGFNASLVLNITDVLLGGISTTAAHIIDSEYEVSPLANYFFVVFSSIGLALIITLVTELFMNKKVRELVDHDDLNYEHLTFSKASDVEKTSAADSNNGSAEAFLDEQGASSSANSSGSMSSTTQGNSGAAGEQIHDDEQTQEELEESLALEPKEIRALSITGLALVIMLGLYFALMFVSGSPLQGEGGAVMESPLIKAVAVPIALSFFFMGLIYGVIARTIKSPSDIPDMMAKGLKTLLPMMVLFFAVSQFLAWFTWTNLGNWTAIKGAELLTQWNLPPLVLFGAFVLLVAIINLLITSGSAQWALMAPVVVPMFMYVGISPEVTQMLFRIGDSPSNIITPMSPYFALALTFLQRYYSKAGIGTLMSLALPYSITMLIGWFLLFCLWWAIGLPLGPGTPMDYNLGG
ncbi:TIGR00366 family protein [Corynebacterium sp. 4HC-13]|uniref:AbgT family transporter n=1 Tax=Corynebacterium anserum TaxID=2684406 RepID=UPI0016395551|nr:AbgT family transporter [Corynebacterium anserum]MBC2681005.1 TIGR00366 family protein [Corynebacterium anserum]